MTSVSLQPVPSLGTFRDTDFGHNFSVTSKNCDVNHSLLSHCDIQKSNFEIYLLFTSIACQSKLSQTVKLRLPNEKPILHFFTLY
jgi:hypothetical protein